MTPIHMTGAEVGTVLCGARVEAGQRVKQSPSRQRVSCPSCLEILAGAVRSRLDALSAAVDRLDTVYEPGSRLPRSHDAGIELARAVVEYFGAEPIDPLLTSDIALLECARAIVAESEGRP